MTYIYVVDTEIILFVLLCPSLKCANKKTKKRKFLLHRFGLCFLGCFPEGNLEHLCLHFIFSRVMLERSCIKRGEIKIKQKHLKIIIVSSCQKLTNILFIELLKLMLKS